MGFLRRQLVTAALTANAVRPPRRYRAGIASFAAGWPTTELAPHLTALTLADAAIEATRIRRRGHVGDTARGSTKRALGLGLAALSSAGLAWSMRQSMRAREVVEDALTEGLGVDYAEQLDAVPTPAELATPWRKLINPFRMRDDAVAVHRDISYNPDFGRRGHLDIYYPAATPAHGAPVLLQVHGGAWILGNKNQQAIPLMQHMAAKGWICVAINYRLSPRSLFPAHIVDVKRAIAWIRENISEYGGDPGYIAITGGSAGGHLTALAALTADDPAYQPGFEDADTSVAAAVPHYGVYDMAGESEVPWVPLMRDGFLAPRVFGTPFADDPAPYQAASPMLRITEDAPDFFVIHGDNDTLVPVPQARVFVDRLRAVSRRRVAYAEVPGAQHAFDVFPSIRSAHVLKAVDRFLSWHWARHRAALSGQAQDALPDDVA